MNIVSISGRLTADPTFRQNQDGSWNVSFCVASRRNFKNRNGEVESDFVWFSRYLNADAYNNPQNPYRLLRKGAGVIVHGKIETWRTIGEGGKAITNAGLVCDSFEWTESKSAADARASAATAAAPAPTAPVTVQVQG